VKQENISSLSALCVVTATSYTTKQGSFVILYLSIPLNVSLTHNIIPSTMQLFPSLLPFTTCFGRKRQPLGVSVMPKLFHCIECPLIHIICKCDTSWFKILDVIIDILVSLVNSICFLFDFNSLKFCKILFYTSVRAVVHSPKRYSSISLSLNFLYCSGLMFACCFPCVSLLWLSSPICKNSHITIVFYFCL
jgi:hypothetical protein